MNTVERLITVVYNQLRTVHDLRKWQPLHIGFLSYLPNKDNSWVSHFVLPTKRVCPLLGSPIGRMSFAKRLSFTRGVSF